MLKVEGIPFSKTTQQVHQTKHRLLAERDVMCPKLQ